MTKRIAKIEEEINIQQTQLISEVKKVSKQEKKVPKQVKAVFDPNGSSIMTEKFVKFILSNHHEALKWPVNFKQIYKATRDGDDKDSFWNKVEG